MDSDRDGLAVAVEQHGQRLDAVHGGELAEVELADVRGAAPLMLLDDPMSELDAGRRERLVEVLRRGGQSVIAATELGLVPGADAADVVRIAIVDGAVLQSAAAEAA